MKPDQKWIDLEGKCFLFCDNGKIRSKLAITSHGMQMPLRVLKSGYGRFRVPNWTTLYFYCPDGSSLDDPGISKVINGNIPPVFEIGPGQYCNDYLLTKYIKDSYLKISYSVSYKNDLFDPIIMDVLSIRPTLFPIKLSEVLKVLERNNYRYPYIGCVFCLTSLSGFIHRTTYTPSPKKGFK